MTAALSVRDVTIKFGGVIAVDRFSLSLETQSVTALIGPNGAGKTTLFNVISRLLTPEKGEIEIQGMRVTRMPAHQIASRGLTRTFQDLRLVRRLTVLENVMLGFQAQTAEQLFSAIYGSRQQEQRFRDEAHSILQTFGLDEKAPERAQNLSYGQQKLLTLAICLATKADILLLDEPVAGVYPETITQIIGLIHDMKRQGKTIFLIEHNLSAAADVADRIVVMDGGRMIADGEPQRVLNDPTIVEAYLG